ARVATVLPAGGAPLARAREPRGLAGDCRLAFTFPADGSYLIQVRDNAYAGAEHAAYRLRVDDAPFASGMFPLGGPRGQTITVTASGGSLPEPRTKSLVLPDQPGAIVEVGPFDGPGGPVLAPARMVGGDRPEVQEATAG